HTRSKRDWSSDVCSSDLIAAVVERRIAVVGGHCAFAGGLGFLGVSVYGHIVVGRDLLEPLLGSLRTAFFLGLGTDADSGRVDLLLGVRSEEHTSELQSRFDLVCRLLLEKKN